jgi:hypothetical protein
MNLFAHVQARQLVSWLRGRESHKHRHGNLKPQHNIFALLLPSSSQQFPERSIEGRWKSVLFVLPNVVKSLGLECEERVLSGTCVVRPLRNRVVKTHSKRFSSLLEGQRILMGTRMVLNWQAGNTAVSERIEITTFWMYVDCINCLLFTHKLRQQ